MSKRNYLNVVSAGVVAFGTLALGLVTVLPVASAANAARTPSAKEQTSVDKLVKAVNEAKTKADYDKALKNLRGYEGYLDLTPAKVNNPKFFDVKNAKTATLKDLKKAYDDAKVNYDKAAKADPEFELNLSKLAKTAYDNAKSVYENTRNAALKNPAVKEAIAKKAEDEGFKHVAAQIRKDKKSSADKLLALLNTVEKYKNKPETKLEDLNVKVFVVEAAETKVTEETKEKKETKDVKTNKETKTNKESKSTKESKTRKNHHKFGAPNTGYEF